MSVRPCRGWDLCRYLEVFCVVRTSYGRCLLLDPCALPRAVCTRWPKLEQIMRASSLRKFERPPPPAKPQPTPPFILGFSNLLQKPQGGQRVPT
jgi:hypothetical protein